MQSQTQSLVPRSGGFTLIELLVVIGILSILGVALLPRVLGASQDGEIKAARVRIQGLVSQIKAFQRKYGLYPPDDFSNPMPEKFKLSLKQDSVNSGIESLVIYLAARRLSLDSIADQRDWFANTDDDKNTTQLPGIDTKDKLEIVDSWGTPIAYFASDYAGYTKAQRVLDKFGEEQRVSALRENGKFLAPGKFQLISAGPDTTFGTDDDITFPER